MPIEIGEIDISGTPLPPAAAQPSGAAAPEAEPMQTAQAWRAQWLAVHLQAARLRAD